MGEKFAECQKIHEHLGCKSDGCQEYEDDGWSLICEICGCHRSFHRKVEKVDEYSHVKCKTEVVYTKCDKLHEFGYKTSVDGCQEFAPAGNNGTVEALTCAACGCHRNFHQNVDAAEVVYTKCEKIHELEHVISVDGCKKFISAGKKGTEAALKCDHCGCHIGFHRKVEVVYTKCQKIHKFSTTTSISVDGCQKFTPSGKKGTEAALKCAVCGCHKSFHRNEIGIEVTKTF